MLYNTPPTSTCHTTPINFATVTCFNCGKDNHFALFCLELKDIGNIKEIEKEEMSHKLGKEEP